VIGPGNSEPDEMLVLGRIREEIFGEGEAFSVEQIVAVLKQAELGVPVTITLDGYLASYRAVHEMPTEDQAWNHTKLRSSKYLNNLIEQDHRGIKSRPGPMPGFKNFDCAATTIAGIELLRRIRKGQFALGRLRRRSRTVPAIWNAVLAA
jgi:transposase-like protein